MLKLANSCSKSLPALIERRYRIFQTASKHWRSVGRVWLICCALNCADLAAWCAEETGGASAPAEAQAAPQRMARTNSGPRRVFRDQVTPHWFKNDSRFWYRNELREGAKEFVMVDAEKG